MIMNPIRTRDELLQRRKEEFIQGAVNSSMKRKFTDEDYTKHFKRSTFFSENKVDNIVGWPPSNNRYENHSEAFFKSRNGWVEKRESEFLNRKALREEREEMSIKERYNNLERSPLVINRQKSHNYPEKPNNLPVVLSPQDGDPVQFSPIPLWKIPYWVNERSGLDSYDVPLYSSLTKNKVFDPAINYKHAPRNTPRKEYPTDQAHVQQSQQQQVQRQERAASPTVDPHFYPEDFLFKPVEVPRKLSTTHIESKQQYSSVSYVSDDCDRLSDASGLSAMSDISSISSASTATATVIATTNKRSSTPRTWSHEDNLLNTSTSGGSTARPLSAGPSRRNSIPDKSPSITPVSSTRPQSARRGSVSSTPKWAASRQLIQTYVSTSECVQLPSRPTTPSRATKDESKKTTVKEFEAILSQKQAVVTKQASIRKNRYQQAPVAVKQTQQQNRLPPPITVEESISSDRNRKRPQSARQSQTK